MALALMAVPQVAAVVLGLLDKQVIEPQPRTEIGMEEMAVQEFQFLLAQSQCGMAVAVAVERLLVIMEEVETGYALQAVVVQADLVAEVAERKVMDFLQMLVLQTQVAVAVVQIMTTRHQTVLALLVVLA
jgi:hypothetical protein